MLSGNAAQLYNYHPKEVILKAFGVFAGLTAASIWGGMYVVSKVVLEVIPPFTLLSSRLILGAVCLLVVLLWKSSFAATKKQVSEALCVGLIGFGVSVGFQFVGTKLSTAANAALVTSASPVFIFIFGAWLLGEQVTLKRVSALALATLGVLAVVDPRRASFGERLFWGNLSLLAAALSWGLYSVLVKRVSEKMSTLEASLIMLIGGLPISLSLSVMEIKSVSIGQITLPVVYGVLYLGLISTALAMYLWNKSLALLDAGVVSLLFFAQPVVGVGLGAGILGESLEMGFWIGAVLIATGLLISARAESPKRIVVER